MHSRNDTAYRIAASLVLATAVAQAVVGAIALNYPNTASPVQIVLLHGVFVALFLGAALLFRSAARERFSARAEAAHGTRAEVEA